MKIATPNHLAARESAPRGSRHCASVVSVRVVEIVKVAIEDPAIADESVVNVNPFDEAAAATEPWIEWFTKAQREPSDTESEASAEKADESGAVNRRAKDRARAPTPPAAYVRPAAIVVRCEAPRLIAHPSPAPRTNVAPIAIAIRGPVLWDLGRVPNMAVIGLLAPGSVVVEVGGTGRLWRNISRRDGILFPQITIIRPLIEPIRLGRLRDRGLDIICAIEYAALTGFEIVRLSAGGHLPLATDHCDAGGIAVLVYVYAECSRLFNGEGQIGRVDFIDVAFANFFYAEVDGAFREPHLSDVLVEVQECQGGHTTEMNGNYTGLQFSAGIFVRPELVADGHGAIKSSAAPVAFATWLKRDRAIDITDSSNSGGWVACVTLVTLVTLTRAHVWSREREKTRKTKKQEKPWLSVNCGLQHGWSPYPRSDPSGFRPAGVLLLYMTPID